MTAHTSRKLPLEGEVVPPPERVDLETVREEWNALAESGGGIFATGEWAEAWWAHHGDGRELLLHACRSADGRLSAVLPLYVWRQRRPRVVRFLGHGPGDELGPAHAPGAAGGAAWALQRVLATLRWDVFLGEQLPGGEGWVDLLAGRIWRRESSPLLRIPGGGWEDYLAARSANFRQQLRRRQRSLERAGSVRLRLADEDSLDRDLDALFALHRARWGGRRTDFSDSPFQRETARRALARGWLRLWLLELDGIPVAAWHGFRVGPIAHYYQAGRDPGYERLSVGFVLLAHTIREELESGATEYRFGRGAEPFKLRFTDDDPGLDTVVLSRGRIGSLAVRGMKAARALRRRARARHGAGHAAA